MAMVVIVLITTIGLSRSTWLLNSFPFALTRSGRRCSRGMSEITRRFTESHERSRLEGMASMREQNMSVWD